MHQVMKRKLLLLLRKTGSLKLADGLMLRYKQALCHRRNQRFIAAHPDFAYPPSDLSFDAYHHVDIVKYLETGRTHARLFAEIIRKTLPNKQLAILEWGCGPARIIRHMRSNLSDVSVMLTGMDFNQRSITWNRDHVPNVDFVVNDFLPPLSIASNSFDVVYNFSVLTHLSEAVQQAWLRELKRVLKPGGLLICTTHGDYYCDTLASSKEAERYRNGQLIVQTGYAEGKKWFLAIHPPRYVKEKLLRDFADVHQVPIGTVKDTYQDVWIALRPTQDSITVDDTSPVVQSG
jgi:ubiquinone/menaquinone biosynthesis C-methylase UbiE